jgi:AcrR family transcriptional regulator
MDPSTDESPTERETLASGREVLRQVREAGREAVREARRTAREINRQARDDVTASAREARESAREAARAAQDAQHGAHRDRDTRTKIQRVGLRLFTEHGYEATSLREIAEELGVTKAALYYHFKSKDEIIKSLADDRLARVGELIAWAQTQPPGIETRQEVVRRYADLLHEFDHKALMQFFERNQSSMAQHPAGSQMREQLFRLLDLLNEPDTPLTVQIRRSMAIFAMHAGVFAIRNPDIDEDERSAAALQVALELVQ